MTDIRRIFDECLALSISKRQDYATVDDNHINFKRSAELIRWFPNNKDKAYVALIGTKLARLANLLDVDKPQNESIEDTFKDLINYCALWAERRLSDNLGAGLSEHQLNQYRGMTNAGIATTKDPRRI